MICFSILACVYQRRHHSTPAPELETAVVLVLSWLCTRRPFTMRLGVTVSLALGAGVSCASASFCDTSDDGSWVQVWGDEFEGDELDETKWTKVTSDEGTVRGPIRLNNKTRPTHAHTHWSRGQRKR